MRNNKIQKIILINLFMINLSKSPKKIINLLLSGL
jgi:hypothetical protein